MHQDCDGRGGASQGEQSSSGIFDSRFDDDVKTLEDLEFFLRR